MTSCLILRRGLEMHCTRLLVPRQTPVITGNKLLVLSLQAMYRACCSRTDISTLKGFQAGFLVGARKKEITASFEWPCATPSRFTQSHPPICPPTTDATSQYFHAQVRQHRDKKVLAVNCLFSISLSIHPFITAASKHKCNDRR